MLNNPEDLDDDRKELGKANKTIVHLSKSLKIREAKLAAINSKYKLYRKGSKSAIQCLEH